MVDDRYDASACQQRLLAGAAELGLDLDGRQQSLMMDFLALLVKWNRAYNLTAVREPLEMVGRHLLDSLALLPHLKSGACLDMGTGAGVPGIPLAIMRPATDFVLLDSNSKKIRFVRQVKLELGLDNVMPVHARVEQYQSDRPFKTLIARAFTDLPKMLALSAGLRQPGSEILAMKGSVPEQEIAHLPAGVHAEVIPLQVPFEVGERCLVRLEQAAGYHAK
ncbi:16S rRNA (guanine(527)-N(7))-methyltransferase RsmG [Candidatus Thiodiazotropha sp. CDECU1]|uniref:16S rRNA (guanine(527)-N(7))-methyltransferase RsmG n=1 Tax=Candidatus Thiodiazotropha sp. CDECU1 TaxID=3065865 RepID=UPI00292E6C00|nr:16S rRNA (guanine(527)-N(7))-methyltransferase RsmG [Candidatus Thiodiazotropha sp. CDECU1]